MMDRARTLIWLRAAAAASLILALVNHLLPPLSFPATQLLFDYEFGLVRRGLAGTLLTPLLDEPVSGGAIRVVTAAVTLTGAMGFALWMMRRFDGSVPGLLVVILALNSFAFASFVGTTGYLDGLLMVVTLAALALAPRGGLAAGLGLAALVVVGMLLHESMLPYFTVLIAFGIALRGPLDARPSAAALLPVATGCAVLVVLVMSDFDAATAERFAAHLRSKADFFTDPTTLEVAGRPLAANVDFMRGVRARDAYWMWLTFDGLPLLLMSLWLIWFNLRLFGPGVHPALRLLMVAAVLAPLSLNLVAFDVHRFGTVSVLAGFIAAGLILRRADGAADRLPALMSWPVFTLLLVVNANMFSYQIQEDAMFEAQFPWVLVKQLGWLGG